MNARDKQTGLRMHEACGGISELSRHAHHRVCVAARAVVGIGRDFSRANEHRCCQHPQSRIYSAARPVGFMAVAFAVMPARGVKTAI